MSNGVKAAGVAWLITAVYYFYQYTLRSAPAVMMPQLSEAFGLSAMGVASLVGLFYYGYSPFSLVAGVAHGPAGTAQGRSHRRGRGRHRRAAVRHRQPARLASVGRFLQGAGGVFALVGAVYIATTNFPASRAATLIGATQMFGMAGGSAGQFVVGPADRRGRPLEHASGSAWASPASRSARCSSRCCRRRRRREQDGDWLKERRPRDGPSSSAIRSRSCAG